MNAPILLDTCAAIMIVEERLSPAAVAVLDTRFAQGEPVFLSPITGWELGLLFSKGRLRSAVTPTEYLRRLTTSPTVRLAELRAEVLMASSFLPGDLNKDPADRIIAATAREYGFTVMTRGRPLLDYARQGYLSAIEC